MLTPLFNHLWQSTLFAVVAGLLTLALRKNHARVRHAVWLAASIKFLIPISLLVALGSAIPWRTAHAPMPPRVTVAIAEVGQPFAALRAMAPITVVRSVPNRLPEVLFAIWACGVLALAVTWLIRWLRIIAVKRAGEPVAMDIPIRVRSSKTTLEPGVFGIFRSVLLLPEGIFERLTPTQIEAVIAHELCHVRNRDNLTATIQMFIETVFWFHPLVWWMGKRMLAERERACDEEVLNRAGSERRAYADAILGVCKLYVESPLACCSGVTGSDLKKRIEAIMINRKGLNMSWSKKLLLAGVAAVSVAGPIAIGMALSVVNLPVLRAQPAPRIQATPASVPQPRADGTAASVAALQQRMADLQEKVAQYETLQKNFIVDGVTHMDSPTIGTLVNGRFHHTLTGIEFTVPLGWTVQYQGQSSNGGEQIGFQGDASIPPVDAFVYFRPETDNGISMHDKLIGSMNFKAGQNSSDESYKMLSNTAIEKTVSGHPALSVHATFIQNGVNMIQYNTWVWSATSHAYISARMKAEDFPVIQEKIDRMAGTFLIP